MAILEARSKTIGILMFDGMEELDAVGPWEVFAWWTSNYPEDEYTATTFSMTGAEVTCEKTLRMTPHQSFAELPPMEVLLHPGGDGTYAMLADAQHLSWLRELRESVPLMTSVCTGATVFAAAGLLRNRPATTNRHALDDLRQIDATITVVSEERFIDDGAIITSAGISAGIDMALHIVGRLAGQDRERDVRQGIEYNPGAR